MKQITSRQNPEISAVAALSDKHERYKQQRFVAEGLRTLSTLIENNAQLEQLYTVAHMAKIAQQLADTNVTLVSDHVMEKMSQASTPSGILGVFRMPEQASAEMLSHGIVLANITDPGNMGTLIRSAVAFNCKSVVIIDGTDPWSSKVIQASAGAIAHITLFQWSWEELLECKANFKLAALVIQNGDHPDKIDAKKTLLIVGNEAEGIPGKWITQCDQLITLPTANTVESLNAAVAGSIALYAMFEKK